MPSRPLKERAPDQSALNAYLGTSDTRPHQRSLQSLWSAHSSSSRAAAPPRLGQPALSPQLRPKAELEDVTMPTEAKETRAFCSQ